MTNEVTLQIIKHLSTIFICRNKVYSNQIFKHILIPMFSGFNTIYSLAYGDFNGLNKFNRLYGNDAGTQAMIDSIRIMKEHLPDDTISVRISGDEFIFLIPSMTSTQVHEELSLAQNILKQSPEQFLTKSFGVVDSNEKSDIYKMY